MGSLLGEVAALARDLLVRKTAPQGGSALLTGGYDETTMRKLSNQLEPPRLMQMLTFCSRRPPISPRSGNRRTDAELCLIRLCDATLDSSPAGLGSARLGPLEERLAQGGTFPAQPVPSQPAAAPVQVKAAEPQPQPRLPGRICHPGRRSAPLCPRNRENRWPPYLRRRPRRPSERRSGVDLRPRLLPPERAGRPRQPGEAQICGRPW